VHAKLAAVAPVIVPTNDWQFDPVELDKVKVAGPVFPEFGVSVKE